MVLKYNAIPRLLNSNNKAIEYFTRRDLLNENVEDISLIWELPEVKKIIKKQAIDGSWKKNVSQKNKNCGSNYSLVETYRQLRFLIDQYELNNNHPSVKKAAAYIFSCQTPEGDIRGILANQYTPYYTGAIIYLLIKAGYYADNRIEEALKWLLSMRQDDGGWVIGSPGILGIPDLSYKELIDLTSNKNRDTMKCFDKNKPFSAAGTGMVIRAFASHPIYQKSAAAITAAKLLCSKFFQKDNWTSYQHSDNWVRFQYPYWWTNIVSALESVSYIGIGVDKDRITGALNWLIANQDKSGLWNLSYSKIHKTCNNPKNYEIQLWLTLAISRIFKRFGFKKT